MNTHASIAVPVLWLSRSEGAPATGYWDQNDLVDMLHGRSPRPMPWLAARHTEVTGDHPIPAHFREGGGVVVVPARFHADMAERLLEDLEPMPWKVLVLTSDEERLFPIEEVVDHVDALWVMTPRPGDELHDDRIRFLDVGVPTDTRHLLRAIGPQARVYDWSFAGQITHERREQAAAAMEGMLDTREPHLGLGRVLRGALYPTQAFAAGMGQADYLRLLARTKLVPCPSGPVTPATFRMWEALEAGCVPIIDATAPTPAHREAPGRYWEIVLGDDHPLPVISDWSQLPAFVDALLEDWPSHAACVGAWYSQRRLALARQFAADVIAARRGAGPEHAPSEAPKRYSNAEVTTVVVTTSPTPGNPSTEMLEDTVESVLRFPSLREAQVVIAADWVRDEQEDRAAAYSEYLRRVAELCRRWPNAVLSVATEHRHQAGVLRDAFDRLVATPYALVLEHDTPLVGLIDWGGIEAWLRDDMPVNLVRLYHEGVVPEEHWPLHLDREPLRHPGHASIIRTSQWSQRPHVVRADWYRELLRTYFAPEASTYVEDVMHGVVDQAYRERGEDGWKEWGLAIYAPPGDMRRSGHSDGRGSDPKYPLRFEYPGGVTPAGAPRATSERAEGGR